MNTQQIQFNRQKMAALLLAGLILATSLVWIEVNISQVSPETGSVKADTVSHDSGLSPEFYLRSITGSKPTGADVGK